MEMTYDKKQTKNDQGEKEEEKEKDKEEGKEMILCSKNKETGKKMKNQEATFDKKNPKED